MRLPKPYFRAQRQTWYVQIGKKQINLGADKAAALDKYYALMAGKQEVTSDTTVVAVLTKFLTWNKEHRSQGTQDIYGRHILSFATHIGDTLTVGKIKPYHINEWIDERYEGRSDNYRRNAIRSVQRAFSWAVEEGHLEASPVAKVKKPAYTPRDAIITQEQWKALVCAVKERPYSQGFLDFLMLLRNTGCRPIEARTAEARHLDRKGRCLVFERHESKGHGGERTTERRVVPLTDEVFDLCVRLALKNPAGPLLRTKAGTPFNRRSIIKWFRRLEGKEKKRKTKAPSRSKYTVLDFSVTAYMLRHTWATEAIERGVDLITVATIMGHKDLTQLMKTYQHMNKKGEHLRRALYQAVGQTIEQAVDRPA